LSFGLYVITFKVMEATEYPITIEQGSTFQKQFRWKVDGVIMNLTGYTAKMQVRKAFGGALGFELSTQNDRILLGGATGTVALEMAPDETAALPAGNFVYDLELTDGGTVRKLIRGTVVVLPEATI
jgi:hypothetical protein